ncbi:MAG TPA: hypothetical protein VFJ85_05910 [Acidimicrobiales bacterium]|nr:hypothetical protein [Acidimicrobiales bacterium]
MRALVAAGTLAAALGAAAPAGAAVTTARVSVATGGTQSANGNLTSDPAISADGQVVAYVSSATNLVAGDTNGVPDVFVTDRAAGTTVRASVGPGGAEGNGASAGPAVSADGRYVAFQSAATNLVAGDSNGQNDVFVFDRQSGTTTRASLATGGATQGNGASTAPSLSADGRFVAYQSGATNLVPGDTNGQSDVFVTDRSGSLTTTRASVVTGGAQGCTPTSPATTCTTAQGAGASTLPSISADGRYVSFTSAATYLVAGDTNGALDVFVADRQTLTTTRESLGAGGAQATGGGSTSSSISADGMAVAFSSDATNLVGGDTNATTDIFVRDRAAASTARVSVGPGGVQAAGGISAFPSLSADGRVAVFDSTATNLVAGDGNGRSDVFAYDRASATTTRVSVGPGGRQGDAGSFFAKVSGDGRFVTYASGATNLVLGDSNATSDIFVTDRAAPSPPATGYRMAADDGGIFTFGDAAFLGSTGASHLNKPIVGMAVTPSRAGYWLVASDGGIFAFGDATFASSAGALRLNHPVVGMAATPTGQGYWLVASDGGIFAFGDAGYFGSTGDKKLNKPIVGMAATPSGGGYWLVASDGGIFAFGDAVFAGSTGATTLNKPIVGMAAAPAGTGYWLVASDGGIFAFGPGWFGSTGATRLNQPIVGMAATPSGLGYWLAASDGGIFAFGDARFLGSTGDIRLNRPMVAIAA